MAIVYVEELELEHLKTRANQENYGNHKVIHPLKLWQD